MKRINIKGVIVFNDYKEIYDWYGIECTSVDDVVNELPTDGSPVEIIINSPGGHVDAGSEIYTHLKAYEGEITTKVYAMAASAASLVAMGGDKALVAPTGQIMIHNVSGIVDGDYRVMHKEAGVLENYNSAIANAYILKTGKTQEEILQMMNDETYLNAQQAVEHGFADGIMFDEVAPKAASMTASLLPKEAVEKARQMIKGNKDKSSVPAASTVEDDTRISELVAQMGTMQGQLELLINNSKEEPEPLPVTSAKRKGFLF